MVGADELLQWGQAPKRPCMVLLIAANGGPVAVVLVGPVAGENENGT